MIRAIALAALIVTPIAAQAQTDPLAQVQQHLRSVTTMTASFVQTDRSGKSVTGTITLKRPGKVRFQYQKGVPLLIVGDGRALTMIDYQVRQVSRWPIGNSPLSALLDPNRDLSKFGKVVAGADGGKLAIEARDPKRPEFGTITIAFARDASAPAGLMLEGWTTLDAQGNRTAVRLGDQRFNVPIDDKAFRWSDPRPRTGRP